MLVSTKVKRAVSSLCESTGCTLPLCEKAFQWHVADGKYTEVSVHGEDVFVRLKSGGYPHSDGFLSDTAEPFADLVLAKQDQHLFLDHPGTEQLLIQGDEFLVR